MSLLYGLSYLCDALLYFAALGLLGMLAHAPERIALAPFILFAGCVLAGRLVRRDRLRFLGLLAVVPCMLMMPGIGPRLGCVIPCVYLGMYIANNRRAADYDYAADRFRYSLIALGVIVPIALLLQPASWSRGLPYLFLFFMLDVTLLRMLRHDDRVARSRRFRALNLMSVLMVCAAGFGLAQPRVVALLRRGWELFFNYVLMNLLRLLIFALQWVFYLFGLLFSWMTGGDDLPGLPQGQLVEPQFDLAQAAQPEVQPISPILRAILTAVGIALVVALVLALLRALSRQMARVGGGSVAEEREDLRDEAAAESAVRPRRGAPPELSVRYWYRRALVLMLGRGGRVTPFMNTLQIEQENLSRFDADALRELRALYLPVRYGLRAASEEDARRARAAYERLRHHRART